MNQLEFQRLLADRRIPIHHFVAEFKHDLETLWGRLAACGGLAGRLPRSFAHLRRWVLPPSSGAVAAAAY
jgi:hypothetical protein